MPRPFTTNTGKHRATLAVVKILVVKSCYFSQCAITRMPWLSTRWCQAKMSVPNRQLMNQDHSESNYYFFVLFVFVLFIYWALKKLKKKRQTKTKQWKIRRWKSFWNKNNEEAKGEWRKKKRCKKMEDAGHERTSTAIHQICFAFFFSETECRPLSTYGEEWTRYVITTIQHNSRYQTLLDAGNSIRK